MLCGALVSSRRSCALLSRSVVQRILWNWNGTNQSRGLSEHHVVSRGTGALSRRGRCINTGDDDVCARDFILFLMTGKFPLCWWSDNQLLILADAVSIRGKDSVLLLLSLIGEYRCPDCWLCRGSWGGSPEKLDCTVLVSEWARLCESILEVEEGPGSADSVRLWPADEGSVRERVLFDLCIKPVPSCTADNRHSRLPEWGGGEVGVGSSRRREAVCRMLRCCLLLTPIAVRSVPVRFEQSSTVSYPLSKKACVYCSSCIPKSQSATLQSGSDSGNLSGDSGWNVSTTSSSSSSSLSECVENEESPWSTSAVTTVQSLKVTVLSTGRRDFP